ncbi:hypothetical protein NTGBS_820046 [Candidatus Nitrotoga sp. BS]|nr:hypothetical protein NTGBS_820046 [Candidatus Nitrotoga sp. BS]
MIQYRNTNVVNYLPLEKMHQLNLLFVPIDRKETENKMVCNR